MARQVEFEVLAGDETFPLIRSVPFLLRLDIVVTCFFEIQLAIVSELYLSKTQMKVFKALLIRFARQRKIKVSLGI